MLSTLRMFGQLIDLPWNAATSGVSASNLFLRCNGSQASPLTTEVNGQRPAPVAFNLWRLQACFTATATQVATLTTRVNGVSQAMTAVIGTGTTVVTTDLTTPIFIPLLALLSVMFKTPVADASASGPRATLAGAAASSY